MSYPIVSVALGMTEEERARLPRPDTDLSLRQPVQRLPRPRRPSPSVQSTCPEPVEGGPPYATSPLHDRPIPSYNVPNGPTPHAPDLLPRRGRIEEGGTLPYRSMAQNGPKWRTLGKNLSPPTRKPTQSTSERTAPFGGNSRHISPQTRQFRRRFRANTRGIPRLSLPLLRRAPATCQTILRASRVGRRGGGPRCGVFRGSLARLVEGDLDIPGVARDEPRLAHR